MSDNSMQDRNNTDQRRSFLSLATLDFSRSLRR